MRWVRFAVLSLVAMALAAGDVSAQTFQWWSRPIPDNLWSNGLNWSEDFQPLDAEPIRPPTSGSNVFINGAGQVDVHYSAIDYAADSVNSLFIGQGSNEGAVHLDTGGSLSTGSLDIGRDGRLGRLRVQGGEITVGSWQPNALGAGTAEVEISSGSMTVNGTIQNNGANTAASWVLTGGSLTAERFRLDPSTELHIGGDAIFRTTDARFDFDGGDTPGGLLTIEGSLATIDITRSSNPAFRADPNSVINFIADAGGFSAINLNGGGLQIGDDGLNDTTLNVDATALGAGIYDLFVHSGGDLWNGNPPGTTSDPNSFGFAFENLTLADSLTGSILYNPGSLQLEIVPEPSSFALLATAGCGLLFFCRRAGRARRRRG